MVTKVTNLVEEIASSSDDQAIGIAQVNEGLNQIGNVTHQNTAGAEQCAAAASELSGQTTNLKGLMETFKVNGYNRKHSLPIPREKKT